VRHYLKNCQTYLLWKARACGQVMAPHLKCRVTPGFRAFSCTGVDYFGPILVKVGRKHAKHCVCLFTCMACRAVHLEVAYSLTANSFLQAFFRFVHGRGPVREDVQRQRYQLPTRRKNFVKEFTVGINPRFTSRYVRKAWSGTSITPSTRRVGERGRFSLNRSRRFCIPLAPVSELYSMKLSTCYWSKLNILNNRPLTPVNDHPLDLSVLTPESLLTGTLDSCLPADVFIEADGFRRSWQSVQLLADCFWKRWVKEDLPLLQHRQKWLKPSNLRVGDVVLMRETNTKRGDWPKALVTDTFAHRDIVRRVRVRIANSLFMRDVRTLPFRGDIIMRCRTYVCFHCLHLCSDVTFLLNLPSRGNECLSIDLAGWVLWNNKPSSMQQRVFLQLLAHAAVSC